MNATTYRECCGTHLGLIAHHAADEPLCGQCRQAELLRRVSVEAWPIGLRHAAALPISREQAERNLAVLMDAMADEAADELPPVLSSGPDEPQEASR